MSDDSQSPHRLIDAKPKRSRAGFFYLSAAALIVGVLAGFLWISQSDLGLPVPTLETEAAAAAETSTVRPTSSPQSPASTPTSLSSPTKPAPTKPAPVRPASIAPSPSPTTTNTPIPVLNSVEAVVGLGGVSLWAADGHLVDQFAQGALFSVSNQSSNGDWVFATSEDGSAGWVRSDEIIIFDTSRLAMEDIDIVPMAPTPEIEVASQAPKTDYSGISVLPTPTQPSQNAQMDADSSNQSVARISLDGGRLNIRSGPGSDNRVIAKALPQEMYAIAGVDSTGEWVLLDVPQVADGIGWVAVEYLQIEANLSDLPVSAARSQSPTFVESDESPSSSVPGQLPAANESVPAIVALQPTSTPIAVLSDATGYHGRLVIQQEWGGSIYLYDLETGNLRLLTGGYDPSFSRDGQRVTFTRGGGENGVYVVDTGTGEEVLLFGGRELLRSPKFSPDGEYIVFERGDQYIRCAGEAWRCRLTPPLPDGELPDHERQPSLARIRADGSDYWDPMDMPYARVPDWNESGIVYQSTAGLQLTQNEPNFEPVEVIFDPYKQYEMDPDWQPGGGSIVFQQKELNHWEIYSVNPDGSDLHGLTKPEAPLAESLPSNVSPAWSPDGQHIVFLSNRTMENTAGEWHVWVMDADGANQRQLPLELPFTYTYVSEQMLDWGR